MANCTHLRTRPDLYITARDASFVLLDADLRDVSREQQWDAVNEWEVVSTILKYDMEKGKEHIQGLRSF